ncbi:hypothetical protein ACFLUH_01675 [Chloroflexota bacterium]
MGIWKLKSCPKCSGDMFIDADIDKTWYEQCLQCSYRHELKSIYELKEEPTQRELEKVPAGRPAHKKKQ